MDDFTKYEVLRDKGTKPRQAFTVARADGLDLVTSIRLLRKVFGLSLAEAKKISEMPDPFDAKQELAPGATVYWEGSTTDEGFYVMEARVMEVVDGLVRVEGHKKYRLTDVGWKEVALNGMQLRSLPIGYFDKSLAERIGEAMQFWQDFPDAVSTKRAV